MEQDKIQKRLDLGMKGKSASVSVPIDVRTEFGRSSTTKHLKKQRILLDNSSITQKTHDGQQRTKELNKKKDTEERFRVPETSKFDETNVSVDLAPKTRKQLINKRKLVEKLHSQAAFGKPKIGIHGKPLPTFYIDPKSAYTDAAAQQEPGTSKTVDWWKSRNEQFYKENPTNVS